ncbi:hypothetical protein ACFXP3_13175 [Streptomyces sp. NPDC059096]|uniref:hypothetical protein n=1 Tax=Streptomyces sp. NPDC059096 TaxID=3346727 RepID=UPI0036BE050E
MRVRSALAAFVLAAAAVVTTAAGASADDINWNVVLSPDQVAVHCAASKEAGIASLQFNC